MKCTEAYTIIQKHLLYYTSDQVKEARGILQQFKEDFEKTDEALEDMTLKEICLHLKESHFSLPDALRKKPCSTIREEYRKRTGKDLDEFYCEKAYRRAAEESEHAKETEHAKQTEQVKDAEQPEQAAKKPDVPVKRFLDIIDAESRLIQIRGT